LTAVVGVMNNRRRGTALRYRSDARSAAGGPRVATVTSCRHSEAHTWEGLPGVRLGVR
jgi:hypothetical protein